MIEVHHNGHDSWLGSSKCDAGLRRYVKHVLKSNFRSLCGGWFEILVIEWYDSWFESTCGNGKAYANFA